MTIDIKATRGEGGMTAEIELVESATAKLDVFVNREASVAVPSVTPTPVSTTKLVPKGSVSVAATQVPTESATTAGGSGVTVAVGSTGVVTEDTAVQAATAATTFANDGPAAQDPPAGPSSGGPVEEPVKKAPVGLFANLKKPINTPALV